MQVTSTYANTVVAMAEAGGPYVIDAGVTLTFIGGPGGKPDTQYSWDFGDGTTATGATATHTYADHGIYVAVLTTVVSQPGGSTTRQYARVQVKSVKPVVDAGAASTCNEGQKVEYTATFTHVEWPETHSATFDFGDDTEPVQAVVAETNQAPAAAGSATAEHAYCESGDYVVTVSVQARDGSIGVATRPVTVHNLPPVVRAADMFAYPCTPINLIAHFVDPGWCETHTAVWDFGDCSPPQPATVRETHNPPAGVGIAVATHRYQACGAYRAECVVTDSKGGSGRCVITVRAIDLVNPGFELGFRDRLVGAVGNGWEPYQGAVAPVLATGAAAFAGEEFVVHGGQRSQRIYGQGMFTAGIHQRIGANIGWDYQVAVWYSLDERAGGKCRLGVDPAGGVDPGAASIVWSAGAEDKEWSQLVVRVTARGHAITLFLETQGDARGASAYWDDAQLLPYPCPIRDAKVPAPVETCVDWSGGKADQSLGATYMDKGFIFKSLAQTPLRLVSYGVPAGVAKLLIPPRGLDIGLPFEAKRVTVALVEYTKEKITVGALDRTGAKLAAKEGSGLPNEVQTIGIDHAGIASVRLTGGGERALLVRICAYKDAVDGCGCAPGESANA